MEKIETINIMRLLFAMKLHIFLVVPTFWDLSPLDRCNLGTRQIGGREILCRRFYYIDCGTTCFADIPSFRSKLSQTLWSIIRWFDSIEKGAKQAVLKNSLRRFYYLYRSQYSDLSCFPYTFLLVSLSHFLIFCWSSSEEMQTRRSFDPDSKTPCHSYLRKCAMCAWLQSLLRNVFIFGIFHSWNTEIEIDSLAAYPNEDLWYCLFVRVS